MSRIRRICLVAGLATITATAQAGGGPENVLLVVNAAEPISLAVANHFIHLRQIPAINVVYLDRVPEGRQCAFELFRDRIGNEIVQAMEQRKIIGQIDIIVFSTNFPTAVNCAGHLETLKQQVRLPKETLFNPVVSTNSLMMFYLYAVNGDPSFLAMDANWYMSPRSADVLTQPFRGEQQEIWQQGIAALQTGDNEAAIGIFSKVIAEHPLQVAGFYQLARALAQAGRVPESLVALRRAVAAGWQYRQFTADDPMLAPLDNESEFQKMLLEMPNTPFGEGPTRGFSSQMLWGKNGWPNSPDQGKRLWLSTMLGVAGGMRGCSGTQIIQQLQRSVAADGTMPMGSFFFSNTGDIRTRTRQPGFADAIRDLQRLGFRASEIRSKTPNNRADVLGATLGAADIDWIGSGSRFLPGALCDNLTSYGGNLQDNASQTPLTDYLKMGAAGASGTVIEPFAVAQKFPSPRLHVHYARGCCLAEAFYQSVSGPFQLLIVGDPLCQPWARFPRFAVTGLNQGDTVEANIQLTIERDATGPEIGRYELFIDGRRIAVVPGVQKRVSVAVGDLTDGWHELRVVAVDNTRIGTKSRQSRGFVTVNNGREVKLTVAGDGRYQAVRSILVSASSDGADAIQIRQNGRLMAVVDGDSGEAQIDCYDLGLGPCTLTAGVQGPNGVISSQPVSIEINP